MSPNIARFWKHKLFHRVGLLNFFQNFQGYNKRIALDFADTYDGACTQVGGMLIAVSKASIAFAMGLMQTREH